MEKARSLGIERSDSWLAAALSEYAAIRDEIVSALSAQHSVFSYGIAAVGLLTAVAIGATSGEAGSENAQILVTAILLCLNPVLLVVILVLWTSEVLRMERGGTYMLVLETIINSKIDGPAPLAWEGVVNRHLSQPGRSKGVLPHIDEMQQWAVPSALAFIAAGSVLSGLLLGASNIVILVFGLAVTIVAACTGIVALAYFHKTRHWLRNASVATLDVSPPESVGNWADGLEPMALTLPVWWRNLVSNKKRSS